MKSCTALYKTRKVQSILNKVWKEKSEEVLKNTGTLAHFQWKDFKAGFQKGFMHTCKSRGSTPTTPTTPTTPKTRRTGSAPPLKPASPKTRKQK